MFQRGDYSGRPAPTSESDSIREEHKQDSYRVISWTLPVSAVSLNIPLKETRHFPPMTTPLPSWCVKIIRYSFWWAVSATGGYNLVAYAQLGCALPSIALLLKFKPNSTSEGKRWKWRNAHRVIQEKEKRKKRERKEKKKGQVTLTIKICGNKERQKKKVNKYQL